NDNGTYTVRARIIDKDNGFTSYTTDVVVRNVAPTADLANNGPVDEGSPAARKSTHLNASHSLNTYAVFHYQYNCDGSAFGPVNYTYTPSLHDALPIFNDNGTYTVRARIIDKDNGFTSYTTDVVVRNVAPTADLANNGPVDEGSP